MTRSGPKIKRNKSSLEHLFPFPVLLDVLSLLLLHPDREFYQREIAERTASAVIQVQRSLQRIEKAGLCRKARRGNRVYYQAERSHPAFEDFKRALLKTVALGDTLREALRPVRNKVRFAFIFGSVAAGKETASSDIDLLLVGDLTSRSAARILGPVGRRLGREFNPVIFPPDEFRRKAKRRDLFIREILDGPKVWMVGGDDELEGLVT